MVDLATDHKGFFIQNLQSVDSLSSTDISHVAFQVTRRYITQGKQVQFHVQLSVSYCLSTQSLSMVLLFNFSYQLDPKPMANISEAMHDNDDSIVALFSFS